MTYRNMDQYQHELSVVGRDPGCPKFSSAKKTYSDVFDQQLNACPLYPTAVASPCLTSEKSPYSASAASEHDTRADELSLHHGTNTEQLRGRTPNYHTRDLSSSPDPDRKTESTMDPETLTSKDLLTVISRHESSFQRHEAVLSCQEELMAKHSQLLADVMSSIRQLFDRLPGTSSPSPSPSLPSGNRLTPVAEPRLPPPKPFTGDPRSCLGFLTQCSLTFELQPSSFPTDRSKIAYIITRVEPDTRLKRALSWASAVWKSKDACCDSYAAFEEEFKRVFDHPVSGREASKRLLTLNQGSRSTADFAIEFRTIAAGSGWNDEALMVCFQGGLSEPLQDELAPREPATDLESLIAMAIRLDNRLRERRVARRKTSQSQVPGSRPVSPVRSPASRASLYPEQLHDSPEDMQLGRSRLSSSERERRMRERRCLYCGASGHFRSTCPELSGNGGPRPATGGL
ncbi:Pol poly [Labeo rohita]|uniref:Pol poly n=1 Tax=Labeo rohita TaxID=84645 RepID=A0A498M1R3_LABRO|nr:Pol poly [Labeo rohita]